MSGLPEDFVERLARVLEPGSRVAAAEIIEAATRLDDEGLRIFLELFAARVRASVAPVRSRELKEFLQTAERSRGGPPAAP
ncbi:MAG TPA: hypothetical protein VGN13_04470 [Solirubrobacteraceae bacterium]|jgi:hypothetical protein